MIVYDGGGGASSRPESGSLGFRSVCTPAAAAAAAAGIACAVGRVWVGRRCAGDAGGDILGR